MKNLQKLFPLSFKYNGSIKKLALCTVLYFVMEIVLTIAIFIAGGIASVLVSIPLIIFAIPYLGWLLALFLFPLIPLLIILMVSLYIAELFAIQMLQYYVIAGIVVSIIVFAKSEELPEKPKVPKTDKTVA